MKILVIRFSSIGDIVLCSPVLRALREKYPGSEIFFLTKRKFLSLIEFNPNISGTILLEDSLRKVVRQVRHHRFDLIIDLHHNLRSRWIGLLSGKPVLTYRKENLAKWLLIKTGKNHLSGKHVVERYFEAVRPLGISPAPFGLEFYPCDCEEPEESELPEFTRSEKYAVLSIGGTHATKKMPAAKWIELCLFLNCPVIIAGGQEDESLAIEISEGSAKKNNRIFNACGRFSIGGTAHLIKKSSLVISHDTGLMHIASAFQIPVICIWGNTVPDFGFQPYQTRHFNLEVKDLDCRPCSRTGLDACPKGHFNCMLGQNMQSPELWKFINQVLMKEA